MGVFKRVGLRSIRLPTLRFRGKIVLGFAVTLAISAASMGIAYLGFEHVSEGVAAYRKSVTEADLARNIDRELISYRALVRYYVATGKEEDSKAAIAAEAGLKDAIDASMRGTTDPARLERITKLAREFRAFTKIFADILKTKEESDYLTKNALTRSEMSLEYKLDDLASTATEIDLAQVGLVSDQVRFEQESHATIADTERLILMLAIGGFALGAVWALLLGRGISRPMTAMCKAMRELAGGNFDVVLPGLGRKDELGEMASAVEEFKMQAIAKAERDAAAQEAQNKASAAARRGELIRFADEFEAAVGPIVPNL